MMMEEATIRQSAKEWASSALHFDAVITARIRAYIDEIPSSPVGMKYCPACESLSCGVCGDCHNFDAMPRQPLCPLDNENEGRDCVEWWQALKSIITAKRMEEEE